MTDKRKPILCLDFDGVLHAYSSGWTSADHVKDGPVPGAAAFLAKAAEVFEVHVYSSRSGIPGGIPAMQAALRDWCGEEMGVMEAIRFVDDHLHFPTEKPPAFLTIDDRAITFDGIWSDPRALLDFKPWNKRPAVEPALQVTLKPLDDLIADAVMALPWAVADGPEGWRADLADRHADVRAEVRRVLADGVEVAPAQMASAPLTEREKRTLGLATPPEDPQTVLREFRDFVVKNAKVWERGADHNNPIWRRVAAVAEWPDVDGAKPLSPDTVVDDAGFEHTAQTSLAWRDSAMLFSRNEDFYRGIVTKIGEMFGDAAKTSDDGTLQQDVVALRVPELVAGLVGRVQAVDEAARTSRLVEHARRELALWREAQDEEHPQDEEMYTAMVEDALAMVALFASQGHSGGSAGYLLPMLTRLLSWEPLTPLTGGPEEWRATADTVGAQVAAESPHMTWQNLRCSRVFKRTDGTCWDVEAEGLRYPDGTVVRGAEPGPDIVFPYMPKTVIRDCDAEGKVLQPLERYLAFNGPVYYANGGIGDLVGSFDDLTTAAKFATDESSEWGHWWHVVDSRSGKVVAAKLGLSGGHLEADMLAPGCMPEKAD